MLIVEGPDGAGKTTLIEGLKERYGFEVAPRVVSKEAVPMIDVQQWVEENLQKGFQDIIFDRHRLISQPIYGPIMGRTDPGFDDLVWLYDVMNRFYRTPKMTIYCMPPKSVVLKNIENDDDNKAIADKISYIYDAYAAHVATHWSRPFHSGDTMEVWDYTTDGREADPLRTFDGAIRHLFNRYPFDYPGAPLD